MYANDVPPLFGYVTAAVDPVVPSDDEADRVWKRAWVGTGIVKSVVRQREQI